MVDVRKTAAVASAASYSTYIKIKNAEKVAIEVPDFATLLGSNAASVRVDVCDTPTGTYRALHAQGVYSAASGVSLWESLQGSGLCIINCEPAVGHNYLRVHFSTAATDGIDSWVHVME